MILNFFDSYCKMKPRNVDLGKIKFICVVLTEKLLFFTFFCTQVYSYRISTNHLLNLNLTHTYFRLRKFKFNCFFFLIDIFLNHILKWQILHSNEYLFKSDHKQLFQFDVSGNECFRNPWSIDKVGFTFEWFTKNEKKQTIIPVPYDYDNYLDADSGRTDYRIYGCENHAKPGEKVQFTSDANGFPGKWSYSIRQSSASIINIP